MIKQISINPLLKIIISFVLLILCGAFLLTLPVSLKTGNIRFIDALFTSTSAVCVTGLIVVDTATKFSMFGQGIIAALIQAGGLGVMTISVTIFFFLGGKLSVKWQFAFMDIYSNQHRLPIKGILRRVLLYTLTIETIIAIVLFPHFFAARNGNIHTALWDSIFHSISAFCNAGFSTYSDNMVGFAANSIVLLTISADVIMGGIGFYVIMDILTHIRNRIKKIRSHTKQRIPLTLHSKIVLTATATLIIAGSAIIFYLENDNTLKSMPIYDRLINAFFQSVTCRTAGFNSIDISAQHETTLFTEIVLMFIGGSPGSIAGGVKTTTFWIICAMIYAKLKGNPEVVIWNRTIDKENIEKSTTLMLLALIFLSVVTFLFIHMDHFSQRNPFLSSLYEMTSAFGTVGFSTGLTPKMSFADKILTCIVMLTGRLGPLTLFASFTFNKKITRLQYPKENIMVG